MRSTHIFALLFFALCAIAAGWWLYSADGKDVSSGILITAIESEGAPSIAEVDPVIDTVASPGDPPSEGRLERIEGGAADSREGARPLDSAAEGDLARPEHTLSFTVIDAAGAALPGCPIWVLSMDEPGDGLGDELVTDSQGAAQITLPSGKYMYVVNDAKGGAPGESAMAGLSLEHEELQLTDDVERRVMLQRMSASVRAEVVDDLGAPVPGVEVVAVAGRETRVVTGADGFAVLDGLLPGKVNVRVRGDSTLGVAIPRVAGRTIAVGANRRVETRFELARLGTALVTLEAPDGVTTSGGSSAMRNGNPSVSLYPQDSLYESRAARAFVSLEESTRFEALAPGSYRVAVSFPAGSAWTLASELPPIEIRPGETTSLVLRAIEPGEGVEGMVVKRNGEPAALVPLALFLLDADGRPVGGRGKSARTGSDGRFSIQGLVSGNYGVSINVELVAKENHAWPEPSVQPFETFSVPCPELRLTVDPGARIVGTLLGAAEGERVRLEIDRYRFDSPQAFRVEDGRVEIRHLRPGSYRLRWLDRADEALHEESVVLAEGGEAAVTLDLR